MADDKWKYPWQRHRRHRVDESNVVWICLGDTWLKCIDPMANTPPVRDPLDMPDSGYGEPNGTMGS